MAEKETNVASNEVNKLEKNNLDREKGIRVETDRLNKIVDFYLKSPKEKIQKPAVKKAPEKKGKKKPEEKKK